MAGGGLWRSRPTNRKSSLTRFGGKAIAPVQPFRNSGSTCVLRGGGFIRPIFPDSRYPNDMMESPDTDHEAAQRLLLLRNRGLATGLLVLAATLFTVLRFVPEPGFWVELARAASEAAIVGALADWFAVTALFRRPL